MSNSNIDSLATGHRELWSVGDPAFFEYHCLRSHDSSDAQLWYRDHQRITVLSVIEDCDGFSMMQQGEPFDVRSEEGCPLMYEVEFEDGFVSHVHEDELFVSVSFYDPELSPPANWRELISSPNSKNGV